VVRKVTAALKKVNFSWSFSAQQMGWMIKGLGKDVAFINVVFLKNVKLQRIS
jgi:hypothetical protein